MLDGAVKEHWVMWMQLSSRTLWSGLWISSVERKWSVALAHHLTGTFGLLASMYFAYNNNLHCRPDLLKRAKALQKKQRAGEGAPPTPTLHVSSVCSSTPTVPDFMPVHLTRWQGVNSTLPRLAAPAFLGQTTPDFQHHLWVPVTPTYWKRLSH